MEATISVLAPGQEEHLRDALQATPSKSPSDDLHCIVTAYSEATSWQTKRQILSLIVNEYTKEELQDLIPGLSVWRIDQARRHRNDHGPGQEVPQIPITRTNLDPLTADHFIDFITSPTLLQDVAFGIKTMKLSTGEKITVPAAIRSVIPSRIVAMYKLHCHSSGFKPASDSTLYRILNSCPASLQKSLKGLNNYTAEGSSGFESTLRIVNTLADHGIVDRIWVKSTIKRLSEGKNYLKTDYKCHVAPADWCADHCIANSLSDPDNPAYILKCDHDHDISCERCDDLKNVLLEVDDKLKTAGVCLKDEELARLRFAYKHAYESINKWQAHILRTINQEQAKQDILSSLNEHSCLIIMDWAMKFLPMLFREKMSDFFGKRGKSWHVSAIITPSQTSEFEVQCLVHLFDSCKQDWYSIANIIEDVLRTLKEENPLLEEAYLRSDNAGCYHNAQLLFSLPVIGDRTGVRVVRYDFSDPQSGKDVCDRKLAHMKAHIRRYVNEHNDVTTASEMKKALESHGGVKGCRFAVVELTNEEGCSQSVSGAKAVREARMGWALKQKAKASRMTPKVKDWLRDKFTEGCDTGKKADADQVSREMQYVRDESGNLMFSSLEWRTSKQISSHFSRLFAKDKAASHVNVHEEEDTENQEETEGHNEYQEILHEYDNIDLRGRIYQEVDSQHHPIMYENWNICQLTHSNKLWKLKLRELENVCSALGLTTTGPQNRKQTFVKAIEELVSVCCQEA